LNRWRKFWNSNLVNEFYTTEIVKLNILSIVIGRSLYCILKIIILFVICIYIQFWTIVIYCYRNPRVLIGTAWCLISGILIIIVSVLVLALIPVYLPNHSVEVAEFNETCMLSYTSVFHISSFFSNHSSDRRVENTILHRLSLSWNSCRRNSQ